MDLKPVAAETSIHVRDRWQVKPKLTVSYDVRWDYFPFPVRLGTGMEFYNPNTAAMSICGIGSIPTDRGITKDKQHLVPPLGVAYRLTDSTVIRAGYGMATDPNFFAGKTLSSRLNFPYIYGQILLPPNSLSYATTFRQGLPAVAPPDLSSGTVPVPSLAGVATFDNVNYVRGYSQTWNVTLEQRFRSWLASAGYVASRAIDPQDNLQMNWSPINGLNGRANPESIDGANRGGSDRVIHDGQRQEIRPFFRGELISPAPRSGPESSLAPSCWWVGLSPVMPGPTICGTLSGLPLRADLERDNMVASGIRAQRRSGWRTGGSLKMDRRKFIKAATAGTVAITTAVTRANTQRYSFPIIDTHVHLYDPTRPQGVPWPSPEQASIYRTFLPADYRRIAEPFGVVGMIETECSPWVEDNYWVLDVSAKETIVVGEIGDLFPGKPDFAEHLSRLHKNPLYRGIRFAYLWGRDVAEEIRKPQVMADLRLLSDAGLTLDSGGGQKDVPNLLRITDQIPALRIVINHLPGAPIPDERAARATYQQGLRELGKRPQVYVKVSEIFQRVDEKGRRVKSGGRIPRELSFYRPRLDEIWETFGPNRLLFASDWTNSEPMGTFGETLGLVHEYFTQKGPEAVEKFFWKNSLAAYRWVKRQANQPSLA